MSRENNNETRSLACVGSTGAPISNSASSAGRRSALAAGTCGAACSAVCSTILVYMCSVGSNGRLNIPFEIRAALAQRQHREPCLKLQHRCHRQLQWPEAATLRLSGLQFHGLLQNKASGR